MERELAAALGPGKRARKSAEWFRNFDLAPMSLAVEGMTFEALCAMADALLPGYEKSEFVKPDGEVERWWRANGEHLIIRSHVL